MNTPGEGPSFEQRPPQVVVPNQPEEIKGKLSVANKYGAITSEPLVESAASNQTVPEGVIDPNAPAVEDQNEGEIIDPNVEELDPKELTSQERFDKVKKEIVDLPSWLADAKNSGEVTNRILDHLGDLDSNVELSAEDIEGIGELIKNPDLVGNKEEIAKVLGKIKENLEGRLGEFENNKSIPDEVIKRQKTKLEEFFGLAVSAGSEWVKTGAKQTSFSDIMRLFLDCNFDGGAYRGNSLSDVEGSIKEGTADKEFLNKLKKGPGTLAEMMQKAFGSNGEYQNLNHLDLDVGTDPKKIKDVIRYFNEQAEYDDKWEKMKVGLAGFVDESGDKGKGLTDAIKHIFIRLESEDEIKSFFSITEKQETTKSSSGDSSSQPTS